MNKRDLTAKVAHQTGLTAVATSKTISAMFNVMGEELEKGGSIIIQGFGSFSIKERAKRSGVNPLTQKPIIIPARKVVKFSASKNVNIK